MNIYTISKPSSWPPFCRVFSTGAFRQVLLSLLFFTLAACGGGGGGENANQRPSINPISVSTVQDEAIAVDVAQQASDSDGTLVPASVSVATQPQTGTVVTNGDGTVTYTPDKGFVRQDSFSVIIEDNGGAESPPATVNVSIEPKAVTNMITDAGGVVMSADGKASIAFPSGAVANDTDIRMVQLGDNDIPAELRVDGLVAVYEMGPDGSQFDNPLKVEVLLDDDNADPAIGISPLLLFSQDANGIELLGNIETEVQAGGTVVRGDMSHFSNLIVLRLPPVLVTRDQVSGVVGENFTANYSVFASNLGDGIRVFTGRQGLYANAPLAFDTGFGFLSRFGTAALPSVDAPVDQLAYVDDVDFTTPGEGSDSGQIVGRCARFGNADVKLEIYSEGGVDFLVKSIFPNILNAPLPTQPQLLNRIAIPVSCQLSIGGSRVPVANDDTANTASGQAVTIDVIANDIDPDGDLDLLSASVSTDAANGVVTKNGLGQLVYLANQGFSGTDQFQYFVQDQEGRASNFATVTVTVQPGNTGNGLPPVAMNDNVATTTNQAVTINVTANDSDPDGDLVATSTTLQQGPANGSAVVRANGSITYTPNNGFTGSDSFSYFVLDATGQASNDATVNISVQAPGNQAPVANDDTDFTPQNTSLLSEVTLNDTDDGNIVSLSIVTKPTNGTVQNPVVGTRIFYTPNRGFSGTDTVVYTATDDQGAVSNQATLTITVGIVNGGNTPPLVQDDSVNTPQDTAVTFDVLTNDQDIDGQIDRATLQLSSSSLVTRGQLSINADNTLAYTPDNGFVGTDRFAYSVADDQGDRSAEAQVAIVVGSGDPAIANDDVETTSVNQSVTIFVTMNDDGNGALLDANSIQIETTPANGSVTVGIGSVNYTPNQNFVGADTFTYSVSNAVSQRSAPATVTVNVNAVDNNPPQAVNDSADTAVDRPVTIDVTSNDNDSDGQIDATTVTITTAPASGSAVVAANGDVTYTPNLGFGGMDSFQYTVDDDSGATSNAATVTINVSDFLGADVNPVDNISVAELQFLVAFEGRFLSRGIGGFFGFNHADTDSLSRLEQIADYTWLIGAQDSEQGGDGPFDMVTDFQSGTATFNNIASNYIVTGFAPLPLFNAANGSLTVTSQADASVSDNIVAPNTDILDNDAQPAILRGDFNGLATQVQYPDADFTHMFVRIPVTGSSNAIGTAFFVIARIPKEAMQFDSNGMRFREILDATARQQLQSRGLILQNDVAVVFYNQRDTNQFFTGIDQRPVPLAAGRGMSLPAVNLAPRPQACQNVPVNTRCQGGSNSRLLVASSSGDISVHNSDDGSLIDFIAGGPNNPPVFSIGQSQQAVQDPNSSCLLVSDRRDPVGNQGVIHLLDTDGTMLQANFISRGNGANDLLQQPRGMAFYNNDLYVATEGDGRVLQYNAVTGEFIAERVNDPDIQPRDIEFLPNGDLLVSDVSQAGGDDRIILYPADGSERRIIIDSGNNVGTPYQISTTLSGNFIFANFSFGQVRFFNEGAPTLLDVNLGEINSQTYRPIGVYPLQNGNYLVAGSRLSTDPNDLSGISILDISDPQNGLVSNVVPRSGSFISQACMP